MRRVAWRSIRAHLGQFLLTTLAVVLGVTFLSGTLALRSVLSQTFAELTASTFKAELYATGQKVSESRAQGQGGPAPRARVPVSLADELSKVKGVRAAHASSVLPMTLVGADGAPVTSTGAPTLGVPVYSDGLAETLVSGSWPQGGAQIVLESDAMRRSGLSVGQSTHVVVNGTPVEVEVVGEIGYGATLAGATIVGMEGQHLLGLVAPDGMVNSIELFLEDSADLEAVKAEVGAQLPQDAELMTRQEQIDEQNATIEEVLGYVQTFLLVFVVLAMFVGSFIIMNTFAMSVRQRQKELALLRAVGASTMSVFLMILAQAVVIGLVGSALGVLAGTGLTRALVALLEAAGMPLPGGVPMTSRIVVTSVVVGLLVTVVGALAPARTAALTAPVEAMRDVSGAREKPLVVRTVLGLVLVAGGLAGVLSAWHKADLPQRGAVLGLGAGLLVLGLLVVSPALARPLVSLLGAPLRLLRPSGRLGTRNLSAMPRRTAATSAALVIGVALVSAGGAITASMQESVKDIINDSMHADLYVRSVPGGQMVPIPSDYAQRIAQIEGVKEVASYRVSTITFTGPEGQPFAGFLALTEPDTYERAYDPALVSGDFSCMDTANVVATKDSGLKVGDQVTVAGANGSATVSVCAVAQATGVGATAYATPALGAQLGDLTTNLGTDSKEVLDSPHGMLLTLADEGALEEVRGKVQKIVEPSFVFEVLDADQLSDQIGQAANQILGILYALLGLSIAIAILGIVNTLVLSVSERTREIGMLRAVGLGRAQLAGMIITESVLTAVYGTVVGAGTGVLLAAALRAYLADSGLTTLVVPWGQLVSLVVLAVVVGVLAALWPALRATRLPVLEAIASE